MRLTLATIAKMRSSVSTATVPPKKPANRSFTVKAADKQGPAKPTNEDDHFFWTYTEEPHRTRRMAIIKAHPEVQTYAKPHIATVY